MRPATQVCSCSIPQWGKNKQWGTLKTPAVICDFLRYVKMFSSSIFSEAMNTFFFLIMVNITKCFRQQWGIEENSPGCVGTSDFQFHPRSLSRPDTEGVNGAEGHLEVRCRAAGSSSEIATNPDIFIHFLTIHKSIIKRWFSSQSKSKRQWL